MPSRHVRLSLSIEQAQLLKDALMTIADQDAGQRLKLLALHEQVAGALSQPPDRDPSDG